MLDEAPIWDRDGDWLAARAAVAKRLKVCQRYLTLPAAAHATILREMC